MRDGRQSWNPWRTVSKPYALHPLDSRIHASVHDMNSLMGNNQAMSTPNKKAESTGVFLSTLLLLRVFVWTAPRRWEWRNTGLFFVGNFVECLNIYRIFLFEYMCITFCSNSGEEREITGQFEYMSYYLLLELLPRGHLELLVWIYVALPFTQTETWGNQGLNICRITFCSNLTVEWVFPP